VEIYFLFAFAFILVSYRIIRPKKKWDVVLLLSLFLFFLLALALHPWILKSPGWIRLLEISSLGTAALWLLVDPFLRWLEKRKEASGAFVLLRNGRGPLSEIVLACRTLAESRLGALIAIERKISLEEWIQSGIPLDARIRKETICSLFTPPGILHDGGMIVRRDRIAAASVVFPLTRRFDLPTQFGTRHRAALGLSETTDALIITISEETGKISLAERGALFYDIKMEDLSEVLEKALKNRLMREKKRVQVLSKSPALSLAPKAG